MRDFFSRRLKKAALVASGEMEADDGKGSASATEPTGNKGKERGKRPGQSNQQSRVCLNFP